MAMRLGLACSPGTVRNGASQPTRRSQVLLHPERDSSIFAGRKASSLSCSSSDVTLRCQATTTVFPIRTYGDGVLEREVEKVPEVSSMENARAALPGFFEAEAASGRVECSGQGCRPIYDEPFFSVAFPEQFVLESAAEVNGSHTTLYHGRRGGGDAHELRIKPHIPADFVLQEAVLERSATKETLESALQAAPRDPQLLSNFAVFAWRTLGDLDKAEELYKEALEVSPTDTNILASYAHFLWQCDQ